MKDELGDRMKSQYEDRTRAFLPRRTYTIIRVDGKAFHTLTRGYKKPFDRFLMNMMDQTAIALCKEIQGACFGYVQSDEISILLTDFAKISTNAWFDGNIQKMASIAAACATANFNKQMYIRGGTALVPDTIPTAMFDARVFTIPDAIEVENYFIWRQNDATRNSIQMAARAVFSHKECENKSVSDLHEMLHTKGINWNNYTAGEKRGRIIVKQEREFANEYRGFQNGQASPPESIIRKEWVALPGVEGGVAPETPIFTQNRMFLRNLIPEMERFAPYAPNAGASPYDCG
jgi:tRNA(His) guanylyltransferase